MTKKYHNPTNRYATVFFGFGLLCLLTAIFIQAVYIRGTGFKAEYKKRQQAECATKHNSDYCSKNFR